MDWDMCTHITYVFCFEWRWLIGDNMVACFIAAVRNAKVRSLF